jgi:hypothetical protein
MIRLARTSFLAVVYGLLLILLVSPASLNAGLLIVDWGGNYVSATQDLQGKNTFFDNDNIDADGDGTADDSIGGRLFSESTAFSPTTGYSGTSGTFYGGAITGNQDNPTTLSGTTPFDELGIQNQGPNDELEVTASSHGHFHDVHMAVYWDKADFLNGGDSFPVFFDETSSVTVDLNEGSAENLVDAEVRLVVRDDLGNFWLSETAYVSPSQNSSFTWDSANQGFSTTDDGNWASYDPNATFPGATSAGSDLRFDQDSATFSSQDFSSITGIGFFFEQDTFHNNIGFHVSGFEANASVAVPEPSTVTLLGVTALGLLGYRRRKRKLTPDA